MPEPERSPFPKCLAVELMRTFASELDAGESNASNNVTQFDQRHLISDTNAWDSCCRDRILFWVDEEFANETASIISIDART